jgi:glutathionyl-hydroquinone reductase
LRTGEQTRAVENSRQSASSLIHSEINDGVHRCGFAGSRDAYENAYDRLFAALDWVSERLVHQRYLFGDTIDFVQIKQRYYIVGS